MAAGGVGSPGPADPPHNPPFHPRCYTQFTFIHRSRRLLLLLLLLPVCVHTCQRRGLICDVCVNHIRFNRCVRVRVCVRLCLLCNMHACARTHTHTYAPKCAERACMHRH